MKKLKRLDEKYCGLPKGEIICDNCCKGLLIADVSIIDNRCPHCKFKLK